MRTDTRREAEAEPSLASASQLHRHSARAASTSPPAAPMSSVFSSAAGYAPGWLADYATVGRATAAQAHAHPRHQKVIIIIRVVRAISHTVRCLGRTSPRGFRSRGVSGRCRRRGRVRNEYHTRYPIFAATTLVTHSLFATRWFQASGGHPWLPEQTMEAAVAGPARRRRAADQLLRARALLVRRRRGVATETALSTTCSETFRLFAGFLPGHSERGELRPNDVRCIRPHPAPRWG